MWLDILFVFKAVTSWLPDQIGLSEERAWDVVQRSSGSSKASSRHSDEERLFPLEILHTCIPSRHWLIIFAKAMTVWRHI